MGSLIEAIITEISRFVVSMISTFGYTGIFLTMAIESASIPLPSDIIMPFSGYLVTRGQFTMLGVTLAGAIGNVAGSLVAYYVGVWGGRPFVERYGPFMLVSRKDIEMADRWFAKYGEAAVFFGRMLPIVRTFISLPAGIAGVNIYRFILFTFLGSLPWCYLLAYVGVKMEEHGRVRWRRLPHWDLPGATYFVTSCLDGSLPAQGKLHLDRLRTALQANPVAIRPTRVSPVERTTTAPLPCTSSAVISPTTSKCTHHYQIVQSNIVRQDSFRDAGSNKPTDSFPLLFIAILRCFICV